MATAPRDPNFVPVIQGVSSVDQETPTNIGVNPNTLAILSEPSGLKIPDYDYVSMALSAGDTTETYTFKTGGSGGTTVATVTIVYTDSTRDVLSSVTKT